MSGADPAPPAVGWVGIVGGGIMGTGSAEVCARAGLDVSLSAGGRAIAFRLAAGIL